MLTLVRGYSFCPFLMSLSGDFSIFYTLIKLYYAKALSYWASSLALDWILLLWTPRILASFMVHQQPFIGGSSEILQYKVRMLGAFFVLKQTRFLLYFTNSTVCLCEWMTRPAWRKWGALLCGSMVTSYGLWQKPIGGLYWPANAERYPMSPLGTNQKWAKRVDQTLLSWSNFLVSLTISQLLGN